MSFVVRWVLLPVIAIGVLSYGASLLEAHIAGWPRWRPSLILLCILVAAWTWLVASQGSKRSEVKQNAAFRMFLKVKKWALGIIGALVLGVISNAIWEFIK